MVAFSEYLAAQTRSVRIQLDTNSVPFLREELRFDSSKLSSRLCDLAEHTMKRDRVCLGHFYPPSPLMSLVDANRKGVCNRHSAGISMLC